MSQFHILTKPGCPHCDRAKASIKRAGFSYAETVHDTEDLIDDFVRRGFRTFPQVYHGTKHIGGADQTEDYLRSLIPDNDDF